MGEHKRVCGVCGRVPGEPHALLCTSGQEFKRREKAWSEKMTRRARLKWAPKGATLASGERVPPQGSYRQYVPWGQYEKLTRKQKKAAKRQKQKARERASQLAPGPEQCPSQGPAS